MLTEAGGESDQRVLEESLPDNVELVGTYAGAWEGGVVRVQVALEGLSVGLRKGGRRGRGGREEGWEGGGNEWQWWERGIILP